MAMLTRVCLFFGGLNGLIAVAAGAHGRHGVLDPGAREMFAIGAEYQMAHALALLALAWLASRETTPRLLALIAALGFAVGAVLFAGSLYWFGQFGAVPVRGAAPLGGMCLMAGWLCLVLIAVVPARRPGGGAP